MCDKGKKELYNNIQTWIDYCDSRGVKLYVKMPTEAEKQMNDAIDEAFDIFEKGIEKMVNSVGN